MRSITADVAALIGSRICHDLISPIGAINNGLELLEMAGGVEGAELDLIAESVGNASARIRFFRIAFGMAGDQDLGSAEVSEILRDSTAGGRIQVAYRPADALPRQEIRLVFLAILCLESALPYGGTITAEHAVGRWTVSASSQRLNVTQALWEHLVGTGCGADIEPSQVQFLLLPAFAAQSGCSLAVELGTEGIVIRF